MINDKSRIEPIEIEDILKKSYLEYSMSVIASRALPDVRDGLKPSQRRILYAMKELNLIPGKGYRKCAKIAGDTSGNYHPHGEQVVYLTLVRMAQPWSLRYLLIEGQGNFGSQDGDPPAAMRYTEARLHKASVDLMEDIKKDTVDFQQNYDETRKEPVVFPSKFPNLLVNGSSGIAVGMATNMAPHNVGEVCNAIVATIENPEIQIPELMNYVKGPDFPTGGFIIGRKGIKDYFETGHGKVVMRAKTSIETKKNGVEKIIVSEIPYQLNKSLLIKKIVRLVKDKRVKGISDIRDESGRQGMRLVITVKKNYEANTVLNKLYKYSQLQNSFAVNNRALVDGVPRILGMKELIDHYIHFRHEVVVRRTKFELKNAEHRMHILEGYRIALDNIDEVIKTIRSSNNTNEAKEKLQKRFKFSEIQAKAILDMRLQKLTGLEREKIEDEYNEIVKTVKKLKEILEKRELRMNIIKDEVDEIKKKYDDERKTTILEGTSDIDTEDMIADEDMVVTISHYGYIKRMPIHTYKRQKRGGKGLVGSNLKDDDFVEKIFVVSTHAYILFFTDFGKCYWLKVHRIPRVGRLARGKAIVNLLELEKEEKIKAYVTVRDFDMPNNVVIATRKGKIKKSSLKDFSRPRSSGIIAVKLQETDELVDAKITNGSNDIILATRNGYANRFNEADVRTMGRATQGVRGINLRSNDYVIGMVVLDENGDLLAISENGYGKKTDISSYGVTKRGSKGVYTLKTTQRNGHLVSLIQVNDGDNLIIATKAGMIIRMAVDRISKIGRNTQGVKLINLNDDDKVFDITIIPQEEDEELDNDQNKKKDGSEDNDEEINEIVEEMTQEFDIEDKKEKKDKEEKTKEDSEDDEVTQPEINFDE